MNTNRLSTNWFKFNRIILSLFAVYCIYSLFNPNSFFENYDDNETPITLLIASTIMIIFSFIFKKVHFDYKSNQIISKRIFCKTIFIPKENILKIENTFYQSVKVKYYDSNHLKKEIIFTPRLSSFIPGMNPAKNIKEWMSKDYFE